jgi:predicted metal-binding protein
VICEGGGSRLFRNVGSHVKDYQTSNPGGHNINLSMCRLCRNVLDIVINRYAELNTVTGGSSLNEMIQEEMSVFLAMMVSNIVRIKVRMNMCFVLNCYRYSAVIISRPNSVKFLFGGWMQNEVYERKVDTRGE